MVTEEDSEGCIMSVALISVSDSFFSFAWRPSTADRGGADLNLAADFDPRVFPCQRYRLLHYLQLTDRREEQHISKEPIEWEWWPAVV